MPEEIRRYVKAARVRNGGFASLQLPGRVQYDGPLRFADLLVFRLQWPTGSDYDLNVGFAESIQNVNGFRPPSNLPPLSNYVGWSFPEYDINNFIYHEGDNTLQGETGQGIENVVVDLTRQRINMPAWASNSIALELRSYWYAAKATTPLELKIYPILIGSNAAFDPLDIENEVIRLQNIATFSEIVTISFSTDVGTGSNGGDLGDLVAVVEIDFSTKAWNLVRYK